MAKFVQHPQDSKTWINIDAIRTFSVIGGIVVIGKVRGVPRGVDQTQTEIWYIGSTEPMYFRGDHTKLLTGAEPQEADC